MVLIAKEKNDSGIIERNSLAPHIASVCTKLHDRVDLHAIVDLFYDKKINSLRT